MKKYTCDFLGIGDAKYRGLPEKYVKFTVSHQLSDPELWKKFVEVFRHDSDDADRGWRGEYWGKMMRGACLIYMYTGSGSLYRILEDSVKDLLTAARPDGRISTYGDEKQLSGGWDMWARKYVMTGLIHFYNICRSKRLKSDILAALMRHADRILDIVGEGKRSIFDTSTNWGGVNSCSVLEPMVELYKLTGEERYLRFAEYLVHSGGCKDGNLITLAHENKVLPFMYPENKAYETISYFEGVLAYYEVTEEKYYFDAVKKFTEAVFRSDITAIGCAGCFYEQFDNSAKTQILKADREMQETCVTVTWMRMNARLYMLTGEEKYFDRLERSALNALYGSVNTEWEKQYSSNVKAFVDPLPFDSYSPLFCGKRGREVGGFRKFEFGGFYGCCVCIAAAGIALLPLCAAVTKRKEPVFNTYLNGTARFSLKGGNELTATTVTDYPKSFDTDLTVTVNRPQKFAMHFRVPDFCKSFAVFVNGSPAEFTERGGYITVLREWRSGDTVSLKGRFLLRTQKIKNSAAFFYGPLTLARDEAKEKCDLEKKICAEIKDYAVCRPHGAEMLRLKVTSSDGSKILLTDYASCGKKWTAPTGNITVWNRTLKTVTKKTANGILKRKKRRNYLCEK